MLPHLKSHGPDRATPIVPLGRCEICQGKGFIKGIWHTMECAGCNAAGLVNKDTGEALEPSAMVAQLRLRLNGAQRMIDHLQRQLPASGGPAADYQVKSNKHRPGGGNWTGD
jgi:hypothetical protein